MTQFRISLTTNKPEVEIPQLWMQKEDRDTDLWNGGVRSCAVGGCPAVFVINEPRLKVNMDRDWQYYMIAMNYNMTRENIYLLLDDHLAFSNQTGFKNLDNPTKKDYFFNRTEFPEFPRLDKDRTCSRNIMTGVVVGDTLRVDTFNGNNPPPMKPGKSLPETIEDINIEDYLYNPREHRWKFVIANRVTTKPGNRTSVAPFPRGAQYDWTGDNLNYSFLPLVSREVVYYPLRYLYEIPRGSPIPSPYRIVTGD